MPEREDQNFLARWSRRKRQAGDAENDPAPEPGAPKAVSDAQSPDPSEFEADELPARLLDVPEEKLSGAEREWLENRRQAEAIDLESIAYESDFAPFLKRGVPRALRRKAMRKLWASNPLLANLDGLNDYDEDFADPALNTFTSIWQVGRGYLGNISDDGRTATAGETGSVRLDPVETPEPEPDAEQAGADGDEPESEGETASESADAGRQPASDEAENDEPQRVPLRQRLNIDQS